MTVRWGDDRFRSIPEQKIDVDKSIDLDAHDRRCDGRVVCNSFRYHRCPACGATVDTFGGNAA